MHEVTSAEFDNASGLALSKIKSALVAKKSLQSIRGGLERDFGIIDAAADTLIQKAEAEIESEKQAEMLAAFRGKLETLAENDLGIDEHMIAEMEAAIVRRIPQAAIDEMNEQLRKKARRLTVTEIAFMACVHRRSCKEQRGECPMDRHIALQKATKLTPLPFDYRQIRYVLNLLEAFKFTSFQSAKVAPVWEKGKRREGRAELWEWLD